MKLRIEIDNHWIELQCKDAQKVASVLQEFGKLVRLLGPEHAIRIAANGLNSDDREPVTQKASVQ